MVAGTFTSGYLIALFFKKGLVLPECPQIPLKGQRLYHLPSRALNAHPLTEMIRSAVPETNQTFNP